MGKWRIEDSAELYNINGWGINFFSINENGHVCVTPKQTGVKVDLREIIDELQLRDVSTPVLLRFTDILDSRIEKMASSFKAAAEEYNFKAQNFIIYPIKVNQMRTVVEEIVAHGKKFNIGLEAGSTLGWRRFIGLHGDGEVLGMRTFGASGKLNGLLEEFGLTVSAVVSAARRVINNK